VKGFVYYVRSKWFRYYTNFMEEYKMIKVNQEKLQEQITKLKQATTEIKVKAEGKSDPIVRAALKKVKRAQRKLRTAKSYKSSQKKTADAAPVASA